MQSASLGSSMIEIVLDDRATSMDIDALSLGRFRAGRVHAEANMFRHGGSAILDETPA